MTEILKSIADIRERLKEYGDWFAKAKPTLPNAFNMIFNHTTMTLELLNYYYGIWSRTPPGVNEAEIERMRRENAERVLEVTKWAFVFALSSMEHVLKELLKADERVASAQHLQRLRRTLLAGRRVYLSTIVKSCREAEIISDEQHEVWKCLIEVRNAVVHNNAIADRDVVYRVGDLTVTFSKGRVLRGKLDFFVRLLKAAVEHYYMLLRALLA